MLLLCALCLVPASAQANKLRTNTAAAEIGYQNKPIATGATVWFCAYDGGAAIACWLGDAGKFDTRPEARLADPRLPALASDIRSSPTLFAARRVSIPLHTIPYDFALVGKLAEAIMCDESENCGVIFAENTETLQQLVASFANERLAALAEDVVTPPLAADTSTIDWSRAGDLYASAE